MTKPSIKPRCTHLLVRYSSLWKKKLNLVNCQVAPCRRPVPKLGMSESSRHVHMVSFLIQATILSVALQNDCNVAVNSNAGCGVQIQNTASYGPPFNANGGGW